MSVREDFEEHVVPSGARCFYKDSTHSYYKDIRPKRKSDPDGEWQGVGRLSGVSTVVGPADFRPDALLRWAARTNGIGIAQLVNEELEGTGPVSFEWLRSHESIWATLQEEGLTFEDVRDQAAGRGTSVHKFALHELALGHPVPAYAEMTEEEQGYAAGVSGFWLDHNPEPLQAEQVVVDLDLGVAGRFDLRAKLGVRCGRPGCPCAKLPVGEPFLLDAKTSGFISNKAHVQLAGYEHCAVRSGIGGWSEQGRWILQVDAEGGYRVIECRANPGDFAVFVDAYRRSGRISKEAKADRKERDAVV